MRMKKLTALLLVLCLAAALGSSAMAVDLSIPASLTVKLGGREMTEDLPDANVAVDLYLVAAAAEVPGADTYSYVAAEGFEDIAIPEKPDADAWRQIAQQAAAAVLGGETPGTPLATETGETSVVFGELAPGLYLLIARGSDIEDYAVTGEDGSLAAIARSPRYEYTFAPELVSLPGKPADENGVMNTANDGDWIFDQTVTLKPDRAQRYGSLTITKTVEEFGGEQQATFVFDVEGVIGGEVVYSNVATLHFGAAGTQSVTLDKIPATAQVTVTEVYSGARFRVVGSNVQSIESLSAVEPGEVSFRNTYDHSGKGGYGIQNRLTYNGSDWDWEQQ